MILSFSVPDNARYYKIIEWYKEQTSQERSREFRNIFLSYLEKPQHTFDSQVNKHVSLKLERVVNNEREDEEIDFDSKLNLIGRR